MDWFSCTGISSSRRRYRLYWTVVSKSLRSRKHCHFNNIFILLLIIAFAKIVYNILIFYIHICLYIALLLNYWSITIEIIWCFSRSDCNNPSIMTLFFSKYSISGIKSMILFNALDLEHWDAWSDFPSLWIQIYYFPDGGSFNDVVAVEELIWHR